MDTKNNKTTNTPNNKKIKETIDEINLERFVERIMKNAKIIYDASIKVGFNDDDAFDFANQYYRKLIGLDEY